MTRHDGRTPDSTRPIQFTRDFTAFAPGSVLAAFGDTKVLCTASIEERVPGWLRNTGKGWVTAEYSLLPGSTPTRTGREAAKGKQSGRTQEIQRLIGRSLRAVVALSRLPEVQIVLDCDVLQADGGTRTAAISGAYLALHDCLKRLEQNGASVEGALLTSCAAISVGMVSGLPVVDLDYVEDVDADVDMNVVLNGDGEYIEVQGTAEGVVFSRQQLNELCDLAEGGIAQIRSLQEELVREELPYRKVQLP